MKPTLFLILSGSNYYRYFGPSATLKGCINDLWTIYHLVNATLFNQYKVVVITLDDSRDTSVAFLEAIRKVNALAKKGDLCWCHISSHGTTLPILGKNHGALCFYDSNFSNLQTFVIDDQIKTATANSAAQWFFTIDACNFGDSLRVVFNSFVAANREITPRYVVPPPQMQEEIRLNFEHDAEGIRAFIPSHISSIAFCKRGPTFTCSDVVDASGAYGAGSHYFAPTVLRKRKLSVICDATGKALTQNHFEQQPVFAGPDFTLWE